MNNITLQRATLDDIETFIDIEKTGLGLQTYSTMTEKDEVEKIITNSEVYLIKKEGVVAGNVSFEIKSPEHAYIDGLILKPEFQGQGIAREAMNLIMEKVKDYKRIDLVTHPKNTKAIMLYLSLGFEIEAWKDNYFDDGEPRIVLAINK